MITNHLLTYSNFSATAYTHRNNMYKLYNEKYVKNTHTSSHEYRVFQQKSSRPPKTFWNIFTSVKSFHVKFCKFVGSSYPIFIDLS